MADQRVDKMGWKLGSGVFDVYLFFIISLCKTCLHTERKSTHLAILSQYHLCTLKFPLIHLPRISHPTSFKSDKNL